MSCYANACQRLRPCRTNAQCEATWHACNPTHEATPNSHWVCPICVAGWTRITGPRLWVRDPPPLPSDRPRGWNKDDEQLIYVDVDVDVDVDEMETVGAQ